MRKTIELMSVQNDVTFSIRGNVNSSFDQLHSPEVQAEEMLKEFVVISDDESDARLLAVFAQQLLHKHVILLRPVPFAAQLPAVNEVADDVKLFPLRFAEKVQQ